jgi:flagellar motor switch protein FliM
MSDPGDDDDAEIEAGWGLTEDEPAEAGADGAAEAGAAGAGTPDEATPARVLSQTEIDNLLGFDDAPDTAEPMSGLKRIVSAGLISYERLPMLEIVFDRLVRILSTSLRNLTSDNVEVSIDKIISLRFGDYMNSIPLPAMLSVFKAEQWDNFGLMVIDAPMIYSIVDVLLGGRRGTSPMRIEGRPYTTIERTLVEKLATQILGDLSTSFDPICQVNFRHDRTEVNPRFAAISRASNAAILVKLRLEMDDRGGSFEIVLPYATLEPIRDLLLQQFMGERFGRDNIWETHLAEELRETDVELDAVLGEQTMSLSEILALKVGSQIIFPLASDDPVQLRCGGVPLFLARTGNRRNRIAVQIEHKLPRGSVPQGVAGP